MNDTRVIVWGESSASLRYEDYDGFKRRGASPVRFASASDVRFAERPYGPEPGSVWQRGRGQLGQDTFGTDTVGSRNDATCLGG